MSHRIDDSDNFWESVDLHADSKKFDHLTHFLPDDARTVLDIGAGNGALHTALKRHRSVVYTGVDASPEAVRQIESEGGTGIQADIDGARLPFADNSFDAVFACDILEHVRDPWIFLGKMARVSKNTLLSMAPTLFPLSADCKCFRGAHHIRWRWTNTVQFLVMVVIMSIIFISLHTAMSFTGLRKCTCI